MNPYIKNLHVLNIGPFDKLKVQFSNDINIIIGPNSSGKTSILKSICYCFSNYNMEYMRFRAHAEYWAEVDNLSTSFRIGAQDIVSFDQSYRVTNLTNWGVVPLEDVEKTYRPFDENVPYNILAIGANRFFEYKRMSGMQREAKGQERILFYKQQNIQFLERALIPDIKQWMINRYFIIEKDWAKIEASNWNSLLSRLPEISPKNATLKFVKIERDLEPIFEINGRECYMEELSSGFKSFLSIIFSIVDWCEGIYKDENGLIEKAVGTVLIDEVDAHLHPEWQLTIMKSLKAFFPRIQFIVTSHSPLVILSAEKNQVIRIPSHDGTIELKPDEKDFKNWQIEYVLEDLMGAINVDEESSETLLKDIDKAYDEKDINKYDAELAKLQYHLSQKDPLIKYYQIKRSNLFINN